MLNLQFQSSIVNLNRQSAISIANRQSQSPIGNHAIGIHQSEIRNLMAMLRF
jgi:hypothetical protein